MRYIELRDLIGGAFTFIIDNQYGRSLPLEKIEEYGRKVVTYLNEQEKDNWLKISPDKTQRFFLENFDYFYFNEETGLVTLKDGVTFCKLMERYMDYLPLDLILALRDEDICQCLL